MLFVSISFLVICEYFVLVIHVIVFTLLPEQLSVLHPQGVLHDVSPKRLDQDIFVTHEHQGDIMVEWLGRVTLELLWQIEAHPLPQLALLYNGSSAESQNHHYYAHLDLFDVGHDRDCHLDLLLPYVVP